MEDYCDAKNPSTQNVQSPVSTIAPSGMATYYIATMDCVAEESEIRYALEPISGIRGLTFQLGERTLSIDAPADLLPQVLANVRKAGFDPQLLQAPEVSRDPAAAAPAVEMTSGTGLLMRVGRDSFKKPQKRP